MSSPYNTSFYEAAEWGGRKATRQELITYEWRGNELYKVTTVRKFYPDGDWQDEQTTTVLYVE